MKYIITANFGDYEDYVPDYYHKGWKHIYFTDKEMEIPNWEVVVLDNYDKINRHIKACPHEFLPDVTESWWVDANIRLDKIEKHNAEWVTMEHPFRNTIQEELQACIQMHKEDPTLMKKQVEQYLSEGFSGQGLVASGIVYRKHTDKVKEIGEKWWNEILNQSRRDQLSWGYICWKYDFKFKLIPYLHNATKIPHKFMDKIWVIENDGYFGGVLKKLDVGRGISKELTPEILRQKNLRIIGVEQTPEFYAKLRELNIPHVNVGKNDEIAIIYKKLARFIPWLLKDKLIQNL